MPYYEVKPLPSSSRAKKILEEIHPLLIIREVQKRPVLYTRDCPERASPHHRNQVWAEVARAVMPHWDSYSAIERQNRLSDLMKKWRNLRDTFKRQLEVEKRIQKGHNIKKKTYVYFNQMAFLLPHLEPAEEEQPGSKLLRRRALPALTPAPVPTPATALSSASVLAPALATEEIDEDHHFLMSLVPSFRRMTDDEKLSAKMGILKVIQSVRDKSKLREQAEDEAPIALSEIDVKEEMLVDVEPEYLEVGNDTGDEGGDDIGDEGGTDDSD